MMTCMALSNATCLQGNLFACVALTLFMFILVGLTFWDYKRKG